MIYLHAVENLLEPGERKTQLLLWQPGLTFADLVPREWRDRDNVIIARHGESIHDLTLPVRDGDHVTIALVPGDVVAVKLIFLLIVSTEIELALAPRIPPTERGDERSATYGFSGIAPTRSEGTPIPVYFGKLRVGGQVIAEFVESRGPLGSWYNALVSFGYGTIESICGQTEDTEPDVPLRSDAIEELRVPGTLFINDTPATDYDGVELHVRLGTAEQLAIPGFNLDEQTTDITTPLTGPPSTGAAYEYLLPFWPLSPGGTTGPELTTENATWDLYGVAQSILDRDVDHFTVVVQFPQGLYSVSSTGSPYEYATSLAVRYVELDGGGSPITSGGPQGDGYVRLRPTPLYRAEVQGQFTLDFRFPFYDAQTYVEPARSKLASFDFAASGFQEAWLDRTAGLTYPPTWAAASTTAPISAEWWACLRPNGSQTGSTNSALADTGLTKPAPVLDLLDTATSRGFRVVYRLQTFQVAAGQFRDRIVPVVQVGNGSTIKDYFDRNTNGQTGSTTASELGDARWRGVIHYEAPGATNGPQSDWSHGAFTYEPNAVGALDRLRIYCDGELIVEVIATLDLTLPATATAFNVARRTGSNTSNAEYFKGHLDELVLYSRVLTSDELRRSFNTGTGTFHASTTGVVAGYHFEESPPVVGAGGSVADFGTLGNTLTTRLGGGVSFASNVRVGSLLGIMELQPASNTVKRSRYRVEVMRALKDVTSTARVDDMVWSLLQTHVDEPFSFPGHALAAVRVKAQDQLNGSKPTLTFVIEGAHVPIWDGASASSPSFTLAYSRNPAWVLAFLHLDRRGGLGQFFTGRNLDVESFQELADYADELVYDLRGDLRELHDSAGPILALFYSYHPTLLPLGQIEVAFKPGIDPPVHLIAGTYVGFTGLNSPSTNPGTVVQDLNVETIDGFLVTEALTDAQNGGSGGILRLQYQRDATTDYVNPPWGGAGDLVLAITGPGPDLQGTLMGREPRFRFDGAIDTVRPSAEVLQNVVNTCRTILVREGSRMRLRVIKPEAVVDLVGQTQEIRDTFEISYASPDSRPNAYDATILDEDLLWDRSPVPLEDRGVADGTDLGAIRRGSVTYEGITRRSQAFRMMQFVLNSNRLSLRSGKFTCSIDALAIEVGDVIQIAHDCVPRGTSGRVESSSAADTLVLDRTFTLLGGHTYDLSVRTLGGTFQTSTVTSAPGTYVAGVTALTVSPAFDVQPQKGQAVILCEQGLELLARVSRISLTKDLKREVEWLEYSAEALDVDGVGGAPDLPEDLALGLTDLSGSSQATPGVVLELAASERLIRTGGAAAPHVALSWKHDPATEELVARTDLYLAVDTGPWRLLGAAAGRARNALLRLPDSTPGTRFRLAAVAVGQQGARRPLSLAAVVRLTAYARGTAPATPAELTAAVSGDEAVYRVVPGAARAGTTHEVRVGGWILGQPLLSVATGQEDAGSAPWLRGAPVESVSVPPPLLARARAHDGAVSGAALLDPDLLPVGVGALDVDSDESLTQQSWEEYGDGWRYTGSFLVPTPNATLTNLEVNAENELQFAGSALEGIYQTADLTVGSLLATTRIFRQELVHLSAFAVAEQVHPLTFADAAFTYDEAGQLTFEGPASDLGDPEDAGQCRLWLTVRLLSVDGTWSEWQSFRPGPAACSAAQFRINLTRPDASYQVRVRRFSTLLASLPQHAVPNRRIDPASPVDGSLWLRVDL